MWRTQSGCQVKRCHSVYQHEQVNICVLGSFRLEEFIVSDSDCSDLEEEDSLFYINAPNPDRCVTVGPNKGKKNLVCFWSSNPPFFRPACFLFPKTFCEQFQNCG